MNLTRRTLLWSTLTAAVAATQAGRAAAAVAGSRAIVLRVFDSRMPHSRAWLGSWARPTIDVAHERATRWARFRRMNPDGCVAGLTTWTDFVQARGLLQDKGKRLRLESRSGDLFYWEMG